jgi:hypothetical protein
MNAMALQVWSRIGQLVSSKPARTRVRLPKAAVPHPREAGATISVGWPVLEDGRVQSADFRFPPDGTCRGLHVQEYAGCWIVHVDQVHPSCDFVGHVREDHPLGWHLGGATLGAAFGAAVGRSGGAALLGAGLGILIAAGLRSKGSS